MSGKYFIPFVSKAAQEVFAATLVGGTWVEDAVTPTAPAPTPSPAATPTVAVNYTGLQRRGIQQGDFLEMANEPAGASNAMFQADYDRCVAAGYETFRIPANCSARSDINGKVDRGFMSRMRAQVDMAMLALTKAGKAPKVVLDYNHHNFPRKGNSYAMDNFPSGIMKLTPAEHSARDTVTALDVFTEFKDYPLDLSMDVFNEPDGAVTVDILNAWHADLVPKVRATGGNNAKRLIWLEPVEDNWRALTIPGGGNIGLGLHNYWFFEYTHKAAAMSPMVLTAYEANATMMKTHADALGVPLMIGEAGVMDGKGDRAEFIAHILKVGDKLGITTYAWDYAANFKQFSRSTNQWLPGMLDAIAGRLPVRAYSVPAMIDTTKGILWDTSGNRDGTFVGGVLSFGPWSAPWTRPAHIIFPNAPVKSWATFYGQHITCLEYQVRAFVADPTAKSGWRLAKRLSDGQEIADGYRTAAGVPMDLPAMEPGAVLGITLRQGLGGKGQNVPAVNDRIMGISG